MSRPIPNVFVGKNTYGVNTDVNRDRLPEIPQNSTCQLDNVLIGKRDFPIRLCLVGLEKAESTEDVARLVIGAMVSAAGLPHTAAKLTSTAGSYVETLRVWLNEKVYGQVEESDDNVPETEAAGGSGSAPAQGKASRQPDEFPNYVLPEWYSDLAVQKEQHMFAWEVTSMELAAYAGVLAYAIGKQPTAENLAAYNEKRRNAISQFMTSGELQIFVDESPYLTLEILGRVHRAFNSIILDRALVMNAIIDRDHPMISGEPRMFYTIFRLGRGASLNPLLIITRYARKFPHHYGHFPDLHTEFHATAHALQRFFDVAEQRRLYLKVIYGSAYVPVDRRDVDGLLGVAVFALQQTEKSLGNYNGGTLSVPHREKLINLLEITVAREEEVPEEAA
ncbi:hypothetical protein QKS76_gp4 [Cryphonectria parasitica sclerotimonavirus 1]|uniref:Uncharacterized protein n=1 Tax=Cryphonectria parasitica sclerotimonavirus 1 TaxID=2755404 RepID=A0AAE7IF22_9MONO|nr:hypothetical protein QKS76_gp4 [Cryphonectria parasitica sclerotimonavirus 1]QMP84018.1 hypothetical protein [Cryphonectria parasitica sclerotimonavirus 1]